LILLPGFGGTGSRMLEHGPAGTLAIAVPALVAIGDQDERSHAGQLATLLPNARFVRVPGDHASALAAPELTTAILTFLAEL
jgi:pimeloyl-ACP methyl ester carboxylesterase